MDRLTIKDKYGEINPPYRLSSQGEEDEWNEDCRKKLAKYEDLEEQRNLGGVMMNKPNQLYKGNCFDLFKTMPNDSVDYVFTSPPYNRKRNDKYTYYDDTLIDYYEYLCKLIDESMRVAKKHVFINIQSNYYNSEDVYRLFGKYAKDIKQVIIWEKSNPMPANGKNITNSFEYFLVLGEKPLKSNTTYTKNIITTPVNSNMPKNHKAVMRYDVAEWFITHFTQVGDLVLDPNCGIGTTLVACQNNDRRFIGIELVKEYYNMAIERINKDE